MVGSRVHRGSDWSQMSWAYRWRDKDFPSAHPKLDISRLCFENCLQAFLKIGFTECPLVKGKACPQMSVTYCDSWWLLCTISMLKQAVCWLLAIEREAAFTVPCKLLSDCTHMLEGICMGTELGWHLSASAGNKFSSSVYMERTWVYVLEVEKIHCVLH